MAKIDRHNSIGSRSQVIKVVLEYLNNHNVHHFVGSGFKECLSHIPFTENHHQYKFKICDKRSNKLFFILRSTAYEPSTNGLEERYIRRTYELSLKRQIISMHKQYWIISNVEMSLEDDTP